MRTPKQTLGQLGEKIAEKYLVKKGYKIIDRNYRQKWGEIDLIAQRDGVLIFVEVKTLKGDFGQEQNLIPEDHVTKKKIQKLCRTILGYLNHRRIDQDWQLDVIAIEIDMDVLNKKYQYRLRHLKQVA